MLTHLQNKIKALRKFDFQKETRKIIEANKDELVVLQQQQLYSGIGADSKPLTLEGRGYSPFTIQIKIKKGQPTNRITWHDTGELYGSLTAQVRPLTFAITSNNFKFKKMILRSGTDAVGLDFASRKEFIEKVTRPGILKAYREKVMNV